MASPKACIAAFCKDCIYDSTEPGSWRFQVENCTITECALYPVRPVSTTTSKAKRIAANLINTVDITVDDK